MFSTVLAFITTYFRYNTHGLLNIAAALFGLSVGIIVLLQAPRSPINRSFFCLTVNTFVWLICFGMQSLVRNLEDSYFWGSLDYVFGVPFIPVFFFFLSIHLLGKTPSKFWRAINLIWASLAALPMIFFTHRIVIIKEYNWGRYLCYVNDKTTLASTLFVLIPFGILLLASLSNFYHGWKNAVAPADKKRRRNILIAVAIAYTGATDFVTGFGVHIYPFGYISLTLFIAIVAYTIVRHQFFEINILLKKFSLVLLTYSCLLAFMIPLVIYLIKQYFPDIKAAQVGPLIIIAVIIGITIAAGPLIYATAIQRLFWLKNTSSMGLTHELKSPLASIEGATEALLIHNSQSSPDLSKNFDYLHIIQRNTERLNLFVHDLLKIAQIQDDSVVLNKSLIELSKTISEVMVTFQHLANQKNVKIILEYAPNLKVEADEAKIRQVVSNLISNALKFTSEGSITISTSKHQSHISCVIADTGDGIATADIERLFDRFFHGKKSTRGTGLGLAIAKAWVEAHGGKIWAESEGEGKGTKMTFTLPSVS